jgi:hypothetical protein
MKYLAVWDLKKKEEWLSFSDVAARLHSDPVDQRQRVFTQYKRACWLIEEFGFLEIR